MTAIALRGLASRKLRTTLTAVSVLLGVALIAGTFLLTDTIDHSFDRIFATANKGVDVSVQRRQAVGGEDAGTVPAAALRRVRQVPGVAKAAGTVFDNGRILDRHGNDVAAGGAPDFISSADPAPFNAFRYVQGHAPTSPAEVALDEHTADKAGYRLGDRVRVAGLSSVRRYRLVGLAKFGEVGSLAGASVAILTLPQAQRVLGKGASFDSVLVAARPGVSPAQLAGRVRTALPRRPFTVRTGAEEARKQSTDVKRGFRFITVMLLVFGGISLFVGSFMIFNTFSITVAQRMREFALLRTLGASRRQVLAAVLGEALALGLAASALGVLLGFALAPGLKGLFKLFGADLPTSGTVVLARTIWVSLLCGTLVTLAAALAPARRATRVPPVAALTEASVGAEIRGSWRRTAAAIALAVVGAAVMVSGLVGSGSAGRVGLGAGIVFIAAALLSHHAVRPLAAAVGAPLERAVGISGRLARENTVRNPRRTASTAAALMVGVALVAFVTVFAAGLKGSINRAVDRGFTGTLVLESRNFDLPIPGSAVQAIRRVPGAGLVAGVDFTQAKYRGSKASVSGIDEQAFALLYRVTAGAVRGPASVSKSFADKHDLHRGSRIALLTPTGRRVAYRVGSIYEDEGQLLGDITLSAAALRRDFAQNGRDLVFVAAQPGVDAKAFQQRVNALLDRHYPQVRSFTKEQFKADQARQIDQILGLFYVLLSLSVLVSLFGIVTTLALSIHERTRELGMLRAIGASRRQVRRIVRWESVITALIGAAVGVVLGVLFAIVVTRPLADEGFVLSIPVGSLIVLLILAGIAGVAAAIGPARRAAKIDVLRALAYE